RSQRSTKRIGAWIGRIGNQRNVRDAGAQLFEQFQPLSSDGELEIGESGRVSAWSRQTFDQARSNGIGDEDKDHRYGATVLSPRFESGRPLRDETVRFAAEERPGVVRHVLKVAAPKAKIV